ncbi:hypothetical protein [Actinomadura sp. 6N118]|uniref:hypothetical protein n=1 Tax=Actinomadura sp. 6N118 TaxID=3375151 RepID=UPI0037A06B73
MSDPVRSVEMVLAVETALRDLIRAMREEEAEAMRPAFEAFAELEDTFGAAPVRRLMGGMAAGVVAEVARVSGLSPAAVAKQYAREGCIDRRLRQWLIKVLTVKVAGDARAPAGTDVRPAEVLAGVFVALVTYLAADPGKRPF